MNKSKNIIIISALFLMLNSVNAFSYSAENTAGQTISITADEVRQAKSNQAFLVYEDEEWKIKTGIQKTEVNDKNRCPLLYVYEKVSGFDFMEWTVKDGGICLSDSIFDSADSSQTEKFLENMENKKFYLYIDENNFIIVQYSKNNKCYYSASGNKYYSDWLGLISNDKLKKNLESLKNNDRDFVFLVNTNKDTGAVYTWLDNYKNIAVVTEDCVSENNFAYISENGEIIKPEDILDITGAVSLVPDNEGCEITVKNGIVSLAGEFQEYTAESTENLTAETQANNKDTEKKKPENSSFLRIISIILWLLFSAAAVIFIML